MRKTWEVDKQKPKILERERAEEEPCGAGARDRPEGTLGKEYHQPWAHWLRSRSELQLLSFSGINHDLDQVQICCIAYVLTS